MPTRNIQPIDLSALPPHTALRVEIQISGIRQWAIAKELGMSEGQLSKILAGRRPLTDEIADQIRALLAGPAEASA